jgi:anti-sigma B factor antagonist
VTRAILSCRQIRGTVAEDHTGFAVESVRDAGERAVLYVRGEIDLATSDALQVALDEIPRSERLCLDFKDCTFIDSSGMRAVFQAAREFDAAGGEFGVRNIPGQLEELFEMAGLWLPSSPIVRLP